MALRSYKELVVWQKAVALTVEIYKLTAQYPKEELFGLVSQSRRAAVAIASDIAEGYARRNRAEYSRFINIAYASGAELETQLIIAQELRFLDPKPFERAEHLLQEVMSMLNTLEKRLRAPRQP